VLKAALSLNAIQTLHITVGTWLMATLRPAMPSNAETSAAKIQSACFGTCLAALVGFEVSRVEMVHETMLAA